MTAPDRTAMNLPHTWADVAERICAQIEAGAFEEAAAHASRLAGDAVVGGHFDIAHAAYRLRHELVELGASAESVHEHWSVLAILIHVAVLREGNGS